MSVVSNVILAFGCGEDNTERMRDVNVFFSAGCGFGRTLDDREDDLVGNAGRTISFYGGTKALECELAVGAFNYFDDAGFKAHLATIKWEWPEDVTVISHSNDREQPWTIWRLQAAA